MLTGHPPFEGSESAVLIAHATQRPELPSVRLGGEVDGRLEALVMRCLHKSPAQRFADASELLAALQRYQSQVASPEIG